MKNSIFVLLFVIILVGGILAYFLYPKEQVTGTLFKSEFQLRIDDVGFIESQNLKVTFLDVLEDSRCPEGVQCIRAGVVTLLINVNKDDFDLGDTSITLGEGNSSVVQAGGYNITLLSVEPYPTAGKEIEITDYSAKFKITKYMPL